MQEPIRVLMLFTIMNRGGAETMVMNYYRQIDRTRVQFDFMVHREERGAYDDEIEALGGRIYRMLPLHPALFRSYKKQIHQFFDQHSEYRIIHGHCSESGYFVYREAARRGIPVIIAHAHNSHALFDAKWLFRTWFKHRMRPCLTDRFTCGRESAEWLFGKKGAKQALLQNNAIDTNGYQFNPEWRKSTRKALHIADHIRLIGHVGRFDAQKNHQFLIEVMAKLVAKHPDYRLLLVGTGDLEARIREKVNQMGLNEFVIFAGTRADVPCILQAMDLFLFPSLMEGLSLSMVEAQCAGLPCVVSDTIPDEVKMTDLVDFISLQAPIESWCHTIEQRLSYPQDRTVYAAQIRQAGYDIRQNAQWLQTYYIQKINEE